MNKAQLQHTGAEIDAAVTEYMRVGMPAGTLPAQVNLNASVDPLTPKVILDWQWKDDNADGIILCRKRGSYPVNALDGRIANISGRNQTSFEDTAFPDPSDDDFSENVGTGGNRVVWYYRAFPYNQNNQYQTQYQASLELGAKSVGVYYIANGTRLSDLSDYALLDCLDDEGNTKTTPLVKIIFGRWGTGNSNVKDIKWTVKHIDRTNNNAHLVIKESIIGNVAFDVAENSWSESTYNTGNARWAYSNIRQFLNATGQANAWYSPAHEHDHPTSASCYSYPGFLHYFTEAERDLIKTQTRTLYLATNPYGGGTETVDDKVFLLNTKEYGMEPNSGESGPVYDGFRRQADRKWNNDVWTSTIYNHNSYSQLWLCSSAGALNNNIGNNNASNAYYYSVRAGLVIPLSTLLEYDTEASLDENCDVYRVVIPEND